MHLSPAKEAEAARILDVTMAKARIERTRAAGQAASKVDGELIGATEFQLRDMVHRAGASPGDVALEKRTKGVSRVVGLLSALPRVGAVHRMWYPERDGPTGREGPHAGVLSLLALSSRLVPDGPAFVSDGDSDAGDDGRGDAGERTERVRRSGGSFAAVDGGAALSANIVERTVNRVATDLDVRRSEGQTFGESLSWK